MPHIGKHIRINGSVQGVGFRPFAWQIARETAVTGFVRNDGNGVVIEIHGDAPVLDAFVRRLTVDLPPLARIDRMDVRDIVRDALPERFEILASENRGEGTGIVPDAATCPACLDDIRNPADRRFGHAFANCTHCGPRLSIVRTIPYDRRSTSMAAFAMCADCRAEYENPADRRFHAQPIACPACGPRLWFEMAGQPDSVDDPIAVAAEHMRTGKIIAIKGLGGFQIAADAANEAAVADLRHRKHRPRKPLALMARDIEQIRRHCRVSDAEAERLQSAAAPIMLLRAAGAPLADSIAPEQDSLGIMLPNTPLHHLLLSKLDHPIVLTSGNLSDNPQEIDNDHARNHLAPLVDGFLMHDRAIVHRVDDSVLRLDRAGPAVLRRARGLAPAPIRCAVDFETAPKVLAMGGELKSTICLLNGRDAVLSQHIGDLKNAATLADYRKTIRHFLALYRFRPDIIAVDRHPDYLSSVIGRKLAAEFGAQLIAVQHHHAHLASCLAEQGGEGDADRTVLGIVLDGSGWGPDGTVWGGEILKADLRSFERIGHLPQIALPGGEAAIREPWRNLVAHLHAAFGSDYRGHVTCAALLAALQEPGPAMLDQMVMNGVNTPLSSSAGRFFDAVAAALRTCYHRQSYEGQAAMSIESLARPFLADETGYGIDIDRTDGIRFSFQPLWRALLADLDRQVDPGRIAARVHLGLIDVFARALMPLRKSGPDTVVLSGGVFQNAILRNGLKDRCTAAGFRVLTHRRVPENDGGLALGQAVIAASPTVRYTATLRR
ncbi:MAG: carbamoyltransferase HypF [Alphaproteobacteria bacterium]|nr:carbamoyltransferase HypF [Alphaproteobacteria bacterium]